MNGRLEIDGLTVRFPLESTLTARLRGRDPMSLTAVDDVSFSVGTGESIGIVGESGCGKSTLARVLVGLQEATSGELRFDEQPLGVRRRRSTRRRIQMVFQDPSSSLNPARTVQQTLTEVLRVHDLVPRDRLDARCEELLDLVELPRTLLHARPRQLSGGQRQRVGIARALALEPEVLVADEAVAALDVSVQASILNLLADLRARLGLTLVFISHDLAVVRHLADRVLVMYLGTIVEDRPADALFRDPRHPYTRALLAAAPGSSARNPDGVLEGEPPSPIAIPSGCRFRTRCPLADDRCAETEPLLTGTGADLVACHYAWETVP